MAHDVFISYSSKDKPTADAVCATIEANGIRCWIAPRDILPGIDWGEAIIDAINESRIMVLVFSSSANQSVQIKREVERGVSKGLPIIPYRIEDVALSKSLEYFISSPHWLDAITPPVEKHLQFLAETVKLLLSRAPHDREHATPSVESHTASPQTAAVRQKSGLSNKMLASLFGVIFLVGLLFLYAGYKFWMKIHTPVIIGNLQVSDEHNIKRNGTNGMLFHFKFQIAHAKDCNNCAAMVTFHDANRQSLPAHNDTYTTANHMMAVWARFTPGYDPAYYDDLQLFMPYDQITTASGRYDLTFCGQLWLGQTPLTGCAWNSFYVNH